MSTITYLRNTTTNGITDTGDGIVYDLITTSGTGNTDTVTNTTASGTEIQLTNTAGGSTIAFITGRVPSGGVTLTAATTGLGTGVNLLCTESDMNANIGFRVRVFRYEPGPTITELGGGPFNDGVEFGTSAASRGLDINWTDQAFNEDDRLLVRIYLTNVGTMGGGFTGTVRIDDSSLGTGLIILAETVAFKAEGGGGGGSPPHMGWTGDFGGWF
jgi:hypothetical protein